MGAVVGAEVGAVVLGAEVGAKVGAMVGPEVGAVVLGAEVHLCEIQKLRRFVCASTCVCLKNDGINKSNVFEPWDCLFILLILKEILEGMIPPVGAL